ncbi:MAG: hypothetical protein M0C28_05780 [Candidatus Moduliflexus flocculans]|nr:hypothetical protein [Candidatus Moduliflexus flocculans]
MCESKLPAYVRKAEQDFLKAIQLEPWNPEGYVGLGLLYKAEGLQTKAIKSAGEGPRGRARPRRGPRSPGRADGRGEEGLEEHLRDGPLRLEEEEIATASGRPASANSSPSIDPDPELARLVELRARRLPDDEAGRLLGHGRADLGARAPPGAPGPRPGSGRRASR